MTTRGEYFQYCGFRCTYLLKNCKIFYLFIESYKSKIQEQSKQIQDLNKNEEEAKQKNQLDKENLTEQANLIKRFKRKLLLVSKERDSYKSVLGSYENELTFSGAAFEKDRIAAVESSLINYR